MMEKKHLEEHHETRRKDNKVKKKTEKFGTRGRQRGSLKVETMKKKLMSAVKPLISLRLTDVSEDFSWGIKTDNAIIPNNDQDSSSSEQKDELLAYLSNSANFSIDLSCKASKDLSPIKYIVNHLRDRHIVLQHYYLNFQSIHLIAEALACNTVTEYLNLSNNFIDGESAQLLFNIIRVNTFILSVNLSNNNLGRLGAKSCGEMLEGNSVLRSLYISRNHFSDEEIQGIMEALKTNTTLSTLDLSHNKISVLGGICISKLLAINETLSNFDLSWNSIRGKGAEAIGKTLKNNVGMEVLDLSWNGFTLEGIMALRQSLITNKVLKVLDLTNNNLKCKAAEILARTLARNAVLQILILDRNNLEDRGVKALLTVAESHPSLKFLSLQNVPVSSFVCIEIDGMQKKTQTIILHNNLGEDLKSVLCTILLKLLCKFAKENERELKLLFHSTDINYTGILDAEDFLTCIMDAGFLLTQKHMKMIVETLGTGSKGTIHYRFMSLTTAGS